MVAATGAATLACGNGTSAANTPPARTLRVGVSLGVNSLASQTNGVRQIAQNITAEGLGRVAEDGKLEPQLADNWSLRDNGRELLIRLKPAVKFQDASSADARAIASLLPAAIRNLAGSIADDIQSIEPIDPSTLAMRFRRPEPLLTETLEVMIRKEEGGASTGAFMTSPTSPTELVANPSYHLGRPQLTRIEIKAFPSVRSAWAELLRNNIDMLYEVGSDALDSLEGATNVAVFTFTRRYQYAVVLNNQSPALKSKSVRRALNMAVDRTQLVRDALNGHGLPSSGPVWPKHWAIAGAAQAPEFNPALAAKLLKGQSLRFTCLMASDPLYERIGLELKRQLAAFGVDMELKSMPPDALYQAQRIHEYDAALTELISGPTFLRLYGMWHSQGAFNYSGRGNATIDSALDGMRNATSDQQYKQAAPLVAAAFDDDPGAIFLAWSERARAVSRRFAVPPPEPGSDVLRTLRLWTPRNDQRFASRN
ncbi:MAG TPA: ABC transporter substrate-binding protein [Vicinamibacterales bacterium]|nr:ABC transporter substrate-binding protein [Vicinamibacterales bacterium]